MIATDITFRPGTPADGAALLAVHVGSILAVGVAAYDEATARSWSHGLVAEGYGRSMAEGEAFELAVADVEVVGFSGVKGAELCALYVAPARVGQGIGAALLDRALRRIGAAGHPAATLVSSPGAVPFYERHGFRRVAEERVTTRGGIEMAVTRMERPLTP